MQQLQTTGAMVVIHRTPEIPSTPILLKSAAYDGLGPRW